MNAPKIHLPKGYLQSILQFMAHMPQSGDPELSLLKAHLLIEEMLGRLISRAAVDPKYIVAARLSFASKIQLGRAFSKRHDVGWIWGGLKCLNAARTRLAHTLAPEDTLRDMDRFCIIVRSGGDFPEELDDPSFRGGNFALTAFWLFLALSIEANVDVSDLWLGSSNRSVLLSGKP
jgi:hypothetical protein